MEINRIMANIAARGTPIGMCREGVERALRGHQPYMTFVEVCGRGAGRVTLKAIMKRPPSTKFEAFLGYYEGRQLVLKLELTNENSARPRIWATIYNSENVREALRLHLLMDRISRRLILKHSVPKLVPVLNWGKAAVCCVECPGTFFRSSAKRQKTGVICPPPVPLVVVCLVCEYVGSDLQHSEELLKVQADWRENGLITEDSRALMRSILHSAHAMHTMGRTAIMDASFSNMYPITKKTTMSHLSSALQDRMPRTGGIGFLDFGAAVTFTPEIKRTAGEDGDALVRRNTTVAEKGVAEGTKPSNAPPIPAPKQLVTKPPPNPAGLFMLPGQCSSNLGQESVNWAASASSITGHLDSGTIYWRMSGQRARIGRRNCV